MPEPVDMSVARCLACRYALAGLGVARCPECGREFDPADPLTYWTPQKAIIPRAWTDGPRRGPLALAVLAGLLTCMAIRPFHIHAGLLTFAAVLWLNLFVFIALKLMWRARPFSRRLAYHDDERFWARMRGLVWVVLVGAALAGAQISGLRCVWVLPGMVQIANDMDRLQRNWMDVEGEYLLAPGAEAALRVNNGVVIAFKRHRQSIDLPRWDGAARLRRQGGQLQPPVLGRSVLEVRHVVGDWYLWRWPGW